MSREKKSAKLLPYQATDLAGFAIDFALEKFLNINEVDEENKKSLGQKLNTAIIDMTLESNSDLINYSNKETASEDAQKFRESLATALKIEDEKVVFDETKLKAVLKKWRANENAKLQARNLLNVAICIAKENQWKGKEVEESNDNCKEIAKILFEAMVKRDLDAAVFVDDSSPDVNSEDAKKFKSSIADALKLDHGKIAFDQTKLDEVLNQQKAKEDALTLVNQEKHGALKNLSYKSQKKDKRSIPLDYQLNEVDINDAFKNLLQVDPSTKKVKANFVKYNSMYISSAVLYDGASNWKTALQNIHNSATKPYTAYIPLNKGEGHWVMLRVKVNADGVPTVLYMDSLKISKEAVEKLKKELADGVNEVTGKAPAADGVNVESSGKQNNTWACGYYTVGAILDDLLSECDINDPPSHLEPIVKEYREDKVNVQSLKRNVFTAIEGISAETTVRKKWQEFQSQLLANDAAEVMTKLFVKSGKIKEVKAFKEGEIEKRVITDDNENEIEFQKTPNSFAFMTKSKAESALDMMFQKLVELLKKLEYKQPYQIDMETNDEKASAFLIEKGQKNNPKVEFIDINKKQRDDAKKASGTETSSQDSGKKTGAADTSKPAVKRDFLNEMKHHKF